MSNSATAEINVSYAQFLEQLPDFTTIIQLAPGRILGLWKGEQWRAYNVNELLDNNKQLEVSLYDKSGNGYTSVNLGTSTQRGLPVQLWPTLGATPLSPAASQPTGATVRLPVSIPTADTVTTTFAAGATINTLPGTIDGANNAYTQTAVAAAATQLVTSGTLYRELHIKNIGTNAVYLGFDNTVLTTTGYELTALTGTSDEIIMLGFNANLWGIAPVGGSTVSILARG